MTNSLLLDPTRILHGSNQSVTNDAALIINGQIKAFGEEARASAKKIGLEPQAAKKKLLAPCLVDPHSVLEDPINNRVETIDSLRKTAAASGYGQVALLPRSPSWRDRPERLQGFKDIKSDVAIHLWGSFSKNGQGSDLSPHSDLIKHGAIGLAEDDLMLPLVLLQRGLLLGEMGGAPILVAPRDGEIQGNGIVREGVATLRAGWPPDPVASETLPLQQIIELQRQYPERNIRLMNLATAESVKLLTTCKTKPMASVCWWHLVADNNQLSPSEPGWRVTPSLGSSEDREALIDAFQKNVLTAVAVHAIPIDEEEMQLPIDKRQAGLVGHELVLPSLWQTLISESKWSIEQLWNALSFGPSKMLNLPEERLAINSRRWILFDPEKKWTANRQLLKFGNAANQPWLQKEITGKVVSCGLIS